MHFVYLSNSQSVVCLLEITNLLAKMPCIRCANILECLNIRCNSCHQLCCYQCAIIIRHADANNQFVCPNIGCAKRFTVDEWEIISMSIHQSLCNEIVLMRSMSENNEFTFETRKSYEMVLGLLQHKYDNFPWYFQTE